MSEEEYSDRELYYPDEDDKLATHETTSGNTNEEKESSSREELLNFLKEQESKNTERKTTSDINTFHRFLVGIGKENEKIVDLPAHKLKSNLARLFKDVRRQNGAEYKPGTLFGFQRSIQRFLSDYNSKKNILKDEEFALSRKVLEAIVQMSLA